MINGHCFTNLDNVTCDIKQFARVPNIGERVAVYWRGFKNSLPVVQITHDVKDGEPYIVVELWDKSFLRND